MDGAEDNIFLTSSELGTAGRPLSHECITLPLSREIIVPESLSPDGDLKQAERVRPSVETCSAQKGTKRWMQLLQSLLTMGGGSPLKGKPVVVLNLTGYIEDVGCAVSYFHSCVLFDFVLLQKLSLCHVVSLSFIFANLMSKAQGIQISASTQIQCSSHNMSIALGCAIMAIWWKGPSSKPSTVSV